MFISSGWLWTIGLTVCAVVWLQFKIIANLMRRCSELTTSHDSMVIDQEDGWLKGRRLESLNHDLSKELQQALTGANNWRIAAVNMAEREDELRLALGFGVHRAGSPSPDWVAQPQAPNAPFDPTHSDQFFDGIDRHDFYTLGARIVPYHLMTPLTAVDLAGRYWWWCLDAPVPQWCLLPNPECVSVHLFRDQWQRLVPWAVKKFRAMMDTYDSPDPKIFIDHASEYLAIERTLRTAWGAGITHLGCGWLYYTISVACRWLVGKEDSLPFDVRMFKRLLMISWGSVLPPEIIVFLQNDPLTATMPELFQKEPSARDGGTQWGQLQIIQGGKPSPDTP